MFPLPLTPFEYYYLLDNRPDYPTTFPVELLFDGTLEQACFERSLTRAIERHPLLTARIDDSGARPCWVAGQAESVRCDWAETGVPIEHAGGEFIDLRREAGIRCWVRQASGKSRVLFEFHHACCDGLAALLFVQDVLACYKRDATGDPGAAVLREVDPKQLLDRANYVPPGGGSSWFGSGLRDGLITLELLRRILYRSPLPLAAPKASAGTPAALLAFESETFSVEETAHLHQLAGAQGVTSNDLLLRDLLLVLAAWNARQAGDLRGRLRVNMPVSIRWREDKTMPAANRIGFGFVQVKTSATVSPAKLLARVRRQTQRIKDWRLALYFLGGLAIGGKRPALMRWALERNRSLASMVASNVGRFVPEWGSRSSDAWQCGSLTLTRVTGVPPLRPLTRAAAILIEYAGRLTISLRCEAKLFSTEQTRELLSDYVARIRETLARH